MKGTTGLTFEALPGRGLRTPGADPAVIFG